MTELTRVVRFHELGGPEVLRLEEVPLREPAVGEVRIRVDAIGLNRAEMLFRSGYYIEPVKQFPSSLGAEAAGEIEAIGPGVSGFSVGDPVSVVPAFSQNEYSVYAERAIVPAAAVVRRPAGVDAIAGAAIWMPFVTAYGMLVDVGGIRSGDTILLNAASSSVGLAIIQVANHLGVRTIALTRTAAKKSALLEHGASEVIVTETEYVSDRVHALTSGRGVPLVLDAVAGPGITELSRLVAPEGMVIVYGGLSGQPTPYPGIDIGMPALAIRTYTMHETSRDPIRLRRAESFITAGLRTGNFTAVVDRTFSLDDVVAAHAHLESNTQVGKIVATVQH